MKAKAFCFILIILGIFVFSSCDGYVPSGTVTIEAIDGNYLILKKAPADTAGNVIFLDVINTYRASPTFLWKRKIAGEYKEISLSWANDHSLDYRQAYYIMDTIKVPDLYVKFMNSRRRDDPGLYCNQEKLCHENLIYAYLNPGQARSIEEKTSYHFNNLGTLITKANSGLTVKYDPATKSFEEVSPILAEKTSISFIPFLVLIIFILAARLIASVYFDELDARVVSWVIAFGFIIGFSHLANLTNMNDTTGGNLFLGFVAGIVSWLFFRINLFFKKSEKVQQVVSVFLLVLINSVLVWLTTKQLVAITFSSGILFISYMIFLLISHNKSKKNCEKIRQEIENKAKELMKK